MSIRDLVEGECGASNQLMRLGAHVARDSAFKDNVSSAAGPKSRQFQVPNDYVSEFLGQVSLTPAPPQTFRMDTLLKEMRDIDTTANNQQVNRAPNVIHEIGQKDIWTSEFMARQSSLFDQDNGGPSNAMVQPRFQSPQQQQMQNINWTDEFFREQGVIIILRNTT